MEKYKAMQTDAIQHIDDACGRSWYNLPELTAYGYRFFLREHVPSVDNLLLVAICLAWRDDGVSYPPYACVCGENPQPVEYERGGPFDIVTPAPISIERFASEGVKPFVEAKQRSMATLVEFVKSKVEAGVAA